MVEEAEEQVELLHFKLRLTPEMHEKLKILAAQNKRTMSHEIVARLEGSFDAPPALPPGLLVRLRRMAASMKRPAGKLLIDIVEQEVSLHEHQEAYYEEQARAQQLDLSELSDAEYAKIKKYTEGLRVNRKLEKNTDKKKK